MQGKNKSDLELRKYLPFLEFLTSKDPARNAKYTQIACYIREKKVQEKGKCEVAIKCRYNRVKHAKEYVLPKNIIEIFEPVLLEISDESDCEILGVIPGKSSDSNNNNTKQSLPNKNAKSSKSKTPKELKQNQRVLSDDELSSISVPESNDDDDDDDDDDDIEVDNRSTLIKSNSRTVIPSPVAAELRTESAVGSVNRINEATNQTRTNLIVEQSIPSGSREFDDNCQNTINILTSPTRNDFLPSEIDVDVVKQSVERRSSIQSGNKIKSTEPVTTTKTNRELRTDNSNHNDAEEIDYLALYRRRKSENIDKHKSNDGNFLKIPRFLFSLKLDTAFNKIIKKLKENSRRNEEFPSTSRESQQTRLGTKPNNQTNKEFLFSRREKKPTEDQADDGQSQLFSRRNEEISRRSTDVDGEIASMPKTNAKPYNDKAIETVSLLSDEELEIPKTPSYAEQNFQAKVPKESRLSTSSPLPKLPSTTEPEAENRILQTNTISQDPERSTNSLNIEIENLELGQLNDLFSGFCQKSGVKKEELEKVIANFLHSESDIEPNNCSNSIPAIAKQSNGNQETFFNSSSEINSNSLPVHQQNFHQQSQHVSYENPQQNPQFQQQQHIYRNLNNPPPQQTHTSNQNLLHTLIKRNDPRVKSFLKKIENSPIAPSDLRNFAAYTRQISNDQRVPQVPAATSSSTRPIGPQKCPKTYKEYKLQKEKEKAEKLAAELEKIENDKLKLKTKTQQVSSVGEPSSLSGKVPVKLTGTRRLTLVSRDDDDGDDDDDDDFDQPSTSAAAAAAQKYRKTYKNNKLQEERSEADELAAEMKKFEEDKLKVETKTKQVSSKSSSVQESTSLDGKIPVKLSGNRRLISVSRDEDDDDDDDFDQPSTSAAAAAAQKYRKTYKNNKLQKKRSEADELAAEMKKFENDKLKVESKTKQVSSESSKSSSVQESTSLNGKVPIKLSGPCGLISSSKVDEDYDQLSTPAAAEAPKDSVLGRREKTIKNKKKKIGPKCRMKKRKISVPPLSSSEDENEKKKIGPKCRMKKRKISVPPLSSSEDENEKKKIGPKCRMKKRKIFVPTSSSSKNKNENHNKSSQNIPKPANVFDYLSTREIEKALDTVMPAIEDIVTSPLDLTVETGDHNNCSTGSLSPTGKAFSRCARELSNLQCTMNGAPNVISMLTSSHKYKRQSSCVAQQKIGSQLTSADADELNISCDFVNTKTTAAKIAHRRRTLVEKIKLANDVVNENPGEMMIDKTTAKPVSRRRMTCDERIQLRFNHDHDVYSVKQVSQDNQIHQNCSTKHSEEGKNSSDTDQFDYEEYKLQKAKAKAMESKISIVVERLPESVVEEITKRNETGGQQEVVKNLAEDIQASSTNPTQTFAKKSTSFVRNAMNLPPSRISKNTLNTNRDMIYDSTSYCVLCKSKPRSGLTEHYVHRHQTESYVSRLSEEKLDEISSSMQIAELVPTASNARSPKYKVTCGFCNDEIIDTFTNFYAHYSTHTGEYAFRCDSCDLLKPFREDIISHQRHERECRRAKVRLQYLYRSDVTVIHLYACGFCNFVQLNEANTEKHIRDHHRHHYSLANNETNIRGVILAAIVDAQLTNERMDVDEQEEEDEEAYTSHFSGQQILHTDGQALDIKDIFPQFSNEDAEVEEKDSLSNDKVNVEMESSLETGAAERVDTSAPPIPMTVIHNTEPARAHESVFPPGEQHRPLPDPTNELTVKTEKLDAISSESTSVVPPTEEDKSASSTSNYSISTENNNGTSSPYTALTKYREYSMPKPYFGLFKCMAIDCLFSTDDKDQMLQHLSDHRASERPPQGYLECSYCCSSQHEHLTPSALILHIQDRHALSRYQCSQCCYRSCLPGNVQIHRKLCHRDDVEDTNCSTSDNIVYLCAGREITVNEKIDHMRCEMSKNVKPLSCSEISCPTTLCAISCMEEHLANFHKFTNNEISIAMTAKFQPWTCIYCGENVHAKQKMQEHLAINHPDEYAFACHRVLINNSGKVAEDNRIDNLHLVNVSTIVLPKNIRTAEGEEQIFSNSIDNEQEILEKNEIENSSLSHGSMMRSASGEENSHHQINNSEQVNCVTSTQMKVENEEDYISIENADLRPLILKLTSGTGIAPDVLYRCPVKECSAFFSIFELWSKHVSLKHNLFMVDCPHCHHHKTELSLREFSSHFQSHCRHLYICFECATTSVSETECVIHYFENHENGVDLMSEKVNIGGNYSYTIIRKNFEMCHLEMLRHLNNTIRLKLQGIEAQEAAKEMIRWPHQRQEWEDDFPIFVDFGKQAKKCMVPLCPFTTDDNEILFRHVIAEHSVSGQSFTCSNCKFHLNACTDWKPVIDHLRQHLSDLFVCCTCGSSTSSRDVMTTHIKCSHNSRDVIVINYFRSMGVQRFISIDIVLAEKVTTPTLRECFCCEKDVSGGKLTSHLNNEHNLRFRYFCEYCGEKLQNPGNVADHHATMHLDMDCRAFKLRCALMTTSRELRVTKVIPFTLDVPATKKHPLTNDDEGYTGKKIKLENDVIIDDEIVVLEETVDDLPVEMPNITLKCANISNLIDSNTLQMSAAEALSSCTYSIDESLPAPQERTTVPHLAIDSHGVQQNIQTRQPLLQYTPARAQGMEQDNHVSQSLLSNASIMTEGAEQNNRTPQQSIFNIPTRVQGEYLANRTPQAFPSYTPSRFPEAQLTNRNSQPLLPTPTGVQGAHQFNSYPQPSFPYAPISADLANKTPQQPFFSYRKEQTQHLYQTWAPPTTSPYVPVIQSGVTSGMRIPAPSTSNSYPINPPVPPVTIAIPNINYSYTFVPSTISSSSQQPSSSLPSPSQYYYAPQRQSALLNTTTSQYQQPQQYWQQQR